MALVAPHQSDDDEDDYEDPSQPQPIDDFKEQTLDDEKVRLALRLLLAPQFLPETTMTRAAAGKRRQHDADRVRADATRVMRAILVWWPM